jgi:pimeloyl-ACP methyl ester carboxylesterase
MNKRGIRFCSVILLIAAAVYGTICWLGASWLTMPPRKPLDAWQREWLAHPGAHGMRIVRGVATDGTPYLVCEPDAATGPGARGRTLRAQLMAISTPPCRYGEICGTIVLLHGWGMRKESLLSTAERFCAAGLRCVVPDLPGHGENPAAATSFAEHTSERSLPARVLTDAATQLHFTSGPVALWGLSMGGAYALRAAARGPWNAVIVVSSFDALEPVVHDEVARRIGFWSDMLMPGLNVATALRCGFQMRDVRPVESARSVAAPVFIVHGTADPLIPEQAGLRLFRAIPHARKRWLEVAAATHGNVLGTPQHVFCEMARWTLAQLGKSELPAPMRVARMAACPTPTPVN